MTMETLRKADFKLWGPTPWSWQHQHCSVQTAESRDRETHISLSFLLRILKKRQSLVGNASHYLFMYPFDSEKALTFNVCVSAPEQHLHNDKQVQPSVNVVQPWSLTTKTIHQLCCDMAVFRERINKCSWTDLITMRQQKPHVNVYILIGSPSRRLG